MKAERRKFKCVMRPSSASRSFRVPAQHRFGDSSTSGSLRVRVSNPVAASAWSGSLISKPLELEAAKADWHGQNRTRPRDQQLQALRG